MLFQQKYEQQISPANIYSFKVDVIDVVLVFLLLSLNLFRTFF